jgi:hypothetical protein
MRRQIIWILWALAGVAGLAWGGYLTFFPVGMQSTVTLTATGERQESAQATYEPLLGLMVSVVLVVFYGLLGLALYARHFAVFGILAGVHYVLSFLSGASAGSPLYPSSILLLLAAVLTSGLLQDDPKPPIEQQRRNGV